MAILTPVTLGAPFNGTAHNTNLTTIEASLLDVGTYVISGLVPSIGTGLAVNVTSGVASIGGRVTVGAITIGSLTPSSTNHLYITNAGAGTSNTTGTQPANTVKLGTCATGVATVTSVDTSVTSGRQTKVPLNTFLTDASQTLAEGVNIGVGTSTGTKIGTATSQKLAFFNATPVVQRPNTTDLRQVAIDLGFLATGGATPLDLNGGALTASGTNSLGATTLTGNLTLSTKNLVTDTTTGTQIGTGSTQKLGFFGATPVVQRPNTTDIKQVLIDLGFLPVSTGATNLQLNGGQLTAGGASFSGVISGDPSGSGTALQMKSATVTPGSDADYTLTAAEMSCMLLTIVAGSWTSGHNVIVPTAAGGFWHFSNSTGFGMVVKTAAGTGITIANGRAAWLRSNGANVRRMTVDVDPTV